MVESSCPPNRLRSQDTGPVSIHLSSLHHSQSHEEMTAHRKSKKRQISMPAARLKKTSKPLTPSSSTTPS